MHRSSCRQEAAREAVFFDAPDALFLSSHVFQREVGDRQSLNRVWTEQAMAAALGGQLCTPLHTKRLSSTTGVPSFLPTSYQFIKLLAAHSKLQCRKGAMVLAIDDVLDPRKQHVARFCALLRGLMQDGIEVLLVELCGFLTRLRSLQWLMSIEQAIEVHVLRLRSVTSSDRRPTAVYYAPVRRSCQGPRTRRYTSRSKGSVGATVQCQS